MTVYFIQPEGEPFVKIGCADSVSRRLSTLQMAHPRQLVVIGTVPGDYKHENTLHQYFAHYRVRGEWFRLEGLVADFIAALSRPASAWPAAVRAANRFAASIAADLRKVELSVADVAKKHGIATSTIYFLFPGGRHKIQQKRKR